MSGFTQTYVTGMVAGDPDFKFLPSGVAACSFSVPVGKKWKDKQGIEHENTTWYRIQTFGKQAETMNEFVHKGMIITATGEIEVRGYTDKKGEIAVSIDLKAQNVTFIRRADGHNGKESEVDVFADVVMEKSGSGSGVDDLPF